MSYQAKRTLLFDEFQSVGQYIPAREGDQNRRSTKYLLAHLRHKADTVGQKDQARKDGVWATAHQSKLSPEYHSECAGKHCYTQSLHGAFVTPAKTFLGKKKQGGFPRVRYTKLPVRRMQRKGLLSFFLPQFVLEGPTRIPAIPLQSLMRGPLEK